MITFQTFIRKLRLLNMSLPFRPRTAQGILYFLGELIAAQNYSVKPYIPTIYVEGPDGHRHLVPLFVVRRGVPAPGTEAVMVFYRGEPFYIPRPLLGDINEARSMQVLDLVSQAIAAATAKGDLPKTSTPSGDFVDSRTTGMRVNAWRDENPDLRPDLDGAYLQEANLRGANLGDALGVSSNGPRW
jgi:hypothetical protein